MGQSSAGTGFRPPGISQPGTDFGFCGQDSGHPGLRVDREQEPLCAPSNQATHEGRPGTRASPFSVATWRRLGDGNTEEVGQAEAIDDMWKTGLSERCEPFTLFPISYEEY